MIVSRYLSRSDPDRCGHVTVFDTGVVKEVLCSAPTAKLSSNAGVITHAPVCIAHLPMWPDVDVIGAVRGGFRPTWLEMLAGHVRAGWVVPAVGDLSLPSATSKTTASTEHDLALVDALLESGSITAPIANMARSMSLPMCDLQGPRRHAHALAALALDAAVDRRVTLAETVMSSSRWVEEFSLADKVGSETARAFQQDASEAFEKFALYNVHKLSMAVIEALLRHGSSAKLRLVLVQQLSLLTTAAAITTSGRVP